MTRPRMYYVDCHVPLMLDSLGNIDARWVPDAGAMLWQQACCCMACCCLGG